MFSDHIGMKIDYFSKKTKTTTKNKTNCRQGRSSENQEDVAFSKRY